jgi:hypothetical protein
VIVVLVILVVAAIGGVGAYLAMQYSGTTFGSSGDSGARPFTSGWDDRRGGALAERIADAPSGCLVAVLVAVGVWVVLWAVVLVLGLRVLSA